MNKDTIIKILLGIIALLVFAWVWRITSGMLIGTLIVTTSLLLKQDWNAEKNEAAIAVIKVKLNMIDRLQEKTLYDGQSEYYRNLQ